METVVLEVIRELVLELQITFNKGAVMVLPPGVNKASGLTAAMRALDLSRHNVVGVGDAENDSAFLSICGYSVAVANTPPAVKAGVDLVTDGARGAGIVGADPSVDDVARAANFSGPPRSKLAGGRTYEIPYPAMAIRIASAIS